jgi:hypothetical protein
MKTNIGGLGSFEVESGVGDLETLELEDAAIGEGDEFLTDEDGSVEKVAAEVVQPDRSTIRGIIAVKLNNLRIATSVSHFRHGSVSGSKPGQVRPVWW